MAAISVDAVERNAAMVRKLRLPFALLADPGGERAIKPYDLWNADEEVALPAVIVVGRDGEEVLREVGGDFADRLSEDELIEALPAAEPVEQAVRPAVDPQPGERAMSVEAMRPYYLGAMFAAKALGTRAPDSKAAADRLGAEMKRYADAAGELQERGGSGRGN